ncbi:MAG: hypothetical protein GYA14_14530 [Ignavibacteria bacterium]|nr:hypothetical protein [Ignavibacteria bacterium]
MENNSIKSCLYETIHRNKKSVAQLADETGISSSYLYRSALPTDESGVRFPLDYLLPLMKATNNYSVLKHIANLCGFVLTPLPHLKKNKKEKNEMIAEYQDSTVTATKKMIVFFNSPTEDNFNEATKSLHDVLEKSCSAKHIIEKEFSGQLEFYL